MGTFAMNRRGYTPKYARILRQDPCVYCGGPGGTIEHIKPRSLFSVVTSANQGESKDHWTNLASSCYKCNQDRGKRGLLIFLLWKKKVFTQGRKRKKR